MQGLCIPSPWMKHDRPHVTRAAGGKSDATTGPRFVSVAPVTGANVGSSARSIFGRTNPKLITSMHHHGKDASFKRTSSVPRCNAAELCSLPGRPSKGTT